MLSQGLQAVGADSFSIDYQRRGIRTLAPGPLARLGARLRSHSLEQALIAGADPVLSPQLAARAAQLTAPGARAQIADALERVLRAARGPQRRWWAVSPSSPVIANAAEIRELAALLRGDTPVYARGVAILNQLVTDGTGPAYRGTAYALAARLHEAGAAMHG